MNFPADWQAHLRDATCEKTPAFQPCAITNDLHFVRWAFPRYSPSSHGPELAPGKVVVRMCSVGDGSDGSRGAGAWMSFSTAKPVGSLFLLVPLCTALSLSCSTATAAAA